VRFLLHEGARTLLQSAQHCLVVLSNLGVAGEGKRSVAHSAGEVFYCLKQ
jgi:hypothetical protein